MEAAGSPVEPRDRKPVGSQEACSLCLLFVFLAVYLFFFLFLQMFTLPHGAQPQTLPTHGSPVHVFSVGETRTDRGEHCCLSSKLSQERLWSTQLRPRGYPSHNILCDNRQVTGNTKVIFYLNKKKSVLCIYVLLVKSILYSGLYILRGLRVFLPWRVKSKNRQASPIKPILWEETEHAQDFTAESAGPSVFSRPFQLVKCAESKIE